MGMDLNVYAIPKKVHDKNFLSYKELSEEMWDEYLICSWRKWYSIYSMLMERFRSRYKDEITGNADEYIYRMKKCDIEVLSDLIEDLDSNCYSNTFWCCMKKKEKKRYRDAFRKDIKDIKKAKKKGKAIYFEASY